MQSWKAWLLVLLIFLTGAVAGAFGMRAYMVRNLPEMLMRSRESMEDRIVEHITREVGLTDEQKRVVRPLVLASVQRADKVHRGVRAEVDAIFKDMDDGIAAQLTEAQRGKFAELRARMEKLRRERPMPPGMPPPGADPGPPPPGMPSGPPPPGIGPGAGPDFAPPLPPAPPQ